MTRDEISALLPFLANETLADDERREVEAIVATSPELQQELSALQAVRSTMQAEEGFSPGELGLARLMRSVEAEAKPARSRTVLWQAAAAILLAVVLGQAAYQLRSTDPGGYQLAGGTAPAFSVAFRPGASEADLRALLLDAGVEIVSGPSAIGLYGLAPLDGTTLDTARDALEASGLVETLATADP